MEECFENHPYTCLQVLFFNTSNTYRVFGNYFRPRWKPLVDARVGDSRRLLSEVFERKADYFILTTSSEKKLLLNCIKKRKKYMKYCENHVFEWKLYYFYFFFVLLSWDADQGPSKTVTFLRIPSKIFISGTWNFRIIERNIKAIFRECFSSLCEDSGKIFKLMTFRRGPRSTYHILYFQKIF